MSTTTPGADQLQALISYSNNKTGASDTTLSDAVARLVDGYGGGSIENGIVFTELHDSGRPISADIYGDVPPYAFGYFNAGSGCGTSLTNVTFKGNTTKIGGGAFQKTALTSLTIPDSVEAIGAQVLRGSTAITEYVHENARGLYGYNKGAVSALTSTTLSNLSVLQLGAVGKPVTSFFYQAFNSTNLPNTANVIIYCLGEKVDTYLTDIRRNLTNVIIIFKASEATTYNSTSYAAGDTILTSTPNS